MNQTLLNVYGRFLLYEYMGNGSLKDHLHCMALDFHRLLFLKKNK